MTRRDTEARAAELAATPWPSPPLAGPVRVTAREVAGEDCICDECFAAREATLRKELEMENSTNNEKNNNPRTCVVCERVYDGDDGDSTEFSPSTGFYTPSSKTCVPCWLGVGPRDFDDHAPAPQNAAEEPK